MGEILCSLIALKPEKDTNRDAKLCPGSYKGGSHMMLQRSRLEHQELKLLGQQLWHSRRPSVGFVNTYKCTLGYLYRGE